MGEHQTPAFMLGEIQVHLEGVRTCLLPDNSQVCAGRIVGARFGFQFLLILSSVSYDVSDRSAYSIGKCSQLVPASAWSNSVGWVPSSIPSPKPWALGGDLPPYRDSFLRASVKWKNIYLRVWAYRLYWLRGAILCVHHKSLLSAANYWQLKLESCVSLLLAMKI